MNSQIETTIIIKDLVKDIKSPITTDSLINIRDLMYSKITIRPYNDSTKDHEKEIRWKRTASEILQDGYVYSGKACTDLTVLFIALCKALGLETNFVKVTNDAKVHSIAEVKLDGSWYIFDVSRRNIPFKGSLTNESPYLNWKLWKKGGDAWDLGLIDFESISKISE
ncbi:MAG: transglutaminase domain-containing protein [Patescibacteria group bacterium]